MNAILNWIASWGVKKYLLNIVNGVMESKASSVTVARWYVAFYIGKIESVLAFLKSVDAKLADNKIDANEAEAIYNEVKALAADITKSAKEG